MSCTWKPWGTLLLLCSAGVQSSLCSCLCPSPHVDGVKEESHTQLQGFSSIHSDGVIAVNKETGSFTDEYLPEHRSHLYGITAVYPYCPGGKTQKSHPLSLALDGSQAEEINFFLQQGNSNDNFTPKRTSDPENCHCIRGRGKPFAKANEATFRPAKDDVVLNLYLRSLLLYFFFKVRNINIGRNGPVNLKAITLTLAHASKFQV